MRKLFCKPANGSCNDDFYYPDQIGSKHLNVQTNFHIHSFASTMFQTTVKKWNSEVVWAHKRQIGDTLMLNPCETTKNVFTGATVRPSETSETRVPERFFETVTTTPRLSWYTLIRVTMKEWVYCGFSVSVHYNSRIKVNTFFKRAPFNINFSSRTLWTFNI